MRKRLFSAALALVLCLGLSGTALADHVDDSVYTNSYTGESTSDNWTYDLNEDGTATLKMSHVNIQILTDHTTLILPAELDGHPVTKVGEMAFFLHNPWMEWTPQKVVIPEGYTTLEDRAFNGLSVREYSLPSTLTTIGSSVFFDMECQSIDLPASVETVSYSFGRCPSLETVIVRNAELDLSEADLRAPVDFSDSKLTTIVCLPGSLAEAFAQEKGLTVQYLEETASAPAAEPEAAPAAVSAIPTPSAVLVDGVQQAFDAYNIGGANYFKLRDLAYVLSGTGKQFEVVWDGAANAILLTSGQSYTTIGGEMAAGGSGTQIAVPTTSKIMLNGQEIVLNAYNINNANYFKLRDVGQAINFGVSWDNDSRTISINTGAGYTAE